MACQHKNRHVETDENMGGHKFSVYVCDSCFEDLPGDPTADAYDDMVDQQIDMARGK